MIKVPDRGRTVAVVGQGRRAALLLIVLLLLPGCAVVHDAAAPPSAAALVHDGWPGCESLGAFAGSGFNPNETPGTGSVPAGFVATTALICSTDSRTVASGDVVRVGLERRSSDVEPLLAYLARPSRVSHDPGLACSAVGWLRPYLFLLDAAGRWVSPAVPTDACGFALDLWSDAGPAYSRLKYQETAVSTLGVLETAAARRAGCSMSWKDMVAEEAPESHAGRLPADLLPNGRLRVCLYAVPADEAGSEPPVGTFVRGGVLTADRYRRTRAAAVALPAAARGCRQIPGRFLVLRGKASGATLYVEVGGCRRVLLSDVRPSRLAQDDGTLAGLLQRW